MTVAATTEQVLSAPDAAGTFLAADVGGTHVRAARVRASGDAAHPVEILEYRKYRCAEYPSLESILADFCQSGPGVRHCVIASAGYPLADGTVITANLPWPLSPSRIRAQLELDGVDLVNDFEALAHAASQVDASGVLHLTGPQQAPRGPTLVLGPGTGLGAAVWIPVGKGAVVLATEAGQAALAAQRDLEMQIVREMLKQRPYVCVEQVLSGPGLLNLYQALCALRGEEARLATPDAITAAALAGNDAMASRCLDVFCGVLGSVVGDMAVLYGIKGGIHLAGGILPKIGTWLQHSTFVERFLDKGPMREALEQIPVKVVEHGQLGVIGAAIWYLDRTRS